MPDTDIVAPVRDFIEFVDSMPNRTDEELALLLDRLALAAHGATISGEIAAEPVPRERHRTVYANVAAAFPRYSAFDVAFPFSMTAGDTTLTSVDPIDAITDIYLALEQVRDTWFALGAQSAMSLFRFSYDTHWHWHLREMQLYLHARARA
jgi:hypothetical protein